MSNDNRPNPDELLARVQEEEFRARRGKLRIFLGYAAGVGKTYAMLLAARRLREEGAEVVVGYVEPHGRAETEALLDGLEQLPPKLVAYRGTTLREFDLDAALARRPTLILVDELAHTNAEGLRHAKRWQDVDELLQAGIDVYTTLNVQHIESLNDVVARITGVVVRETLPDAVLEQADAFELIDLTPEELIERLREGKVYVPQQAERALQNFFRPHNLTALRELSLREGANRLRRDVHAARGTPGQLQPGGTSERLLVCIGPSPTTARLIRTAKRMAAAFGAEWIAFAVETPGRTLTSEAKAQVAQHLRLAEQLGASTHTTSGMRVAATVLEFARSQNVTKIVIGKTAIPRWKRFLFGTIVDDLLEHSGPIDVYVIQGKPDAQQRMPVSTSPDRTGWRNLVSAAAVVAACGGIAAIGQWLHAAEANVVMVFLLGVAWTAYRYGRWPGVVAAFASVLVFDFFFVPPPLTFAISDMQYGVTFAVMLTIGLAISSLTVRLSEQLLVSKRQERRTAALFQLTRQLSEVQGTDFLVQIAGQRLMELFEGEAVIYVLREGKLQLRFGENQSIAQLPQNAAVAHWVSEHEQPAGMGTDTLPGASAFFVPLVGSQRTVGALGVRSADSNRFLDPEQHRLLTACASLIALSIERDWSLMAAHEARMKSEAEEVRSSLLSSVSHDLRTPLAVVAGAASNLLRQFPPGPQHEALETIVQEAHRMNRLVENLLHMTRLESGAVTLHRQWHVLEEVVGSALRHVRDELASHEVVVNIPESLPLVSLDDLLFEQLLVNLLENAARYTPAGSRIDVSAQLQGNRLVVRVADNGPGIPRGTERSIFEKFVRGPAAAHKGSRSAGLGLAICKAIMQAHGGTIVAQNRETGGVEFLISVPYDATQAPASLPAHETAILP